tara:strand:- start:27786 stop:28334 length:549 start_codon:yes stop_codon:yes gene_type:complete
MERLPYEIKCKIYEYIDITTRICILFRYLDKKKLITMFDLLSFEDKKKWFINGIERKLCHESKKELHPNLLQMLPKESYYLNGLKINIEPSISNIILNCSTLYFKQSNIPIINNFNWQYMNMSIYSHEKDCILVSRFIDFINIIPTIDGDYKDFNYAVKKVWFDFILLLVLNHNSKYKTSNE